MGFLLFSTKKRARNRIGRRWGKKLGQNIYPRRMHSIHNEGNRRGRYMIQGTLNEKTDYTKYYKNFPQQAGHNGTMSTLFRPTSFKFSRSNYSKYAIVILETKFIRYTTAKHTKPSKIPIFYVFHMSSFYSVSRLFTTPLKSFDLSKQCSGTTSSSFVENLCSIVCKFKECSCFGCLQLALIIAPIFVKCRKFTFFSKLNIFDYKFHRFLVDKTSSSRLFSYSGKTSEITASDERCYATIYSLVWFRVIVDGLFIIIRAQYTFFITTLSTHQALKSF